MVPDKIITLALDVLKDYVEERIPAREMIKNYDKIICEYFPWGTDNEKLIRIESFQDKLALFVENPEWRKEDVNYYGVTELNKYVKELIDFIKN